MSHRFRHQEHHKMYHKHKIGTFTFKTASYLTPKVVLDCKAKFICVSFINANLYASQAAIG
jgi:hypothetical protein